MLPGTFWEITVVYFKFAKKNIHFFFNHSVAFDIEWYEHLDKLIILVFNLQSSIYNNYDTVKTCSGLFMTSFETDFRYEK